MDETPAEAQLVVALDDVVAGRAAEIDQILDVRWWQLWSRRPWDSEARKSLSRIRTSLTALTVHAKPGALVPKHELELRSLLQKPLRGRSLDSLIEVVYELDELLVQVADDEYVRRVVCAESLPDEDNVRLDQVQAGLTKVGPVVGGMAEQRQELLTMLEMRRFRYRRLRSRRRMKTGHLIGVAFLLLGLTLALALAIEDPTGPDGPDAVLLCAVAGALGGTLANLYKLRDEIGRGTELRAFKPILIAQPAVGAAAGLIVLLIVASGLLGTTTAQSDGRWQSLTLLAFAAGFSEAFFLGLVRRVAGAAEGDRAKKDEAGAR